MEHIKAQFQAYLLTEKRVARNTFDAYARDIDQLAVFLLKRKKRFDNTRHNDLIEFLRYLKSSLNLSARTVSRKISSIKTLFNYLSERHGYTNSAADLIFPKLEKRLPEYLTEQEVEKLFEQAEADTSDLGVRNKVMLILLYVTGVRISELVHLRSSDIQFDTGLVAVSGKGGKERLVPLPQPVVPLLQDYLDKIHPRLIKKRGQNDYLFPIRYGKAIKPISRQAFWAILKKLAMHVTSKKSISPHKLRHSLATHMLKKGADLRSLQLLLGHENLSTVEIYTHVEMSYARKIYDKKHPRS